MKGKIIAVLIFATLLFVSTSFAAEIIGYKYDDLGRVIKTIYDDESYIVTSYIGTSTLRYQEAYYTGANAWAKTVEYMQTGYYPGIDRKFMWLADANPGTQGDIVYIEFRNEEHFFTDGSKAAIIVYDTGDSKVITYQHGRSEIYQEAYFDANGAWRKTIEYYDYTSAMRYQWVADNNPSVSGDGVYYSYDTKGRLTHRVLDTTETIVTQYWGDTYEKQYDYFYSASSSWQKTVEYYSDGITMHNQWVLDANPSLSGDAVYYGYDTQGRLVQKTLDNGAGAIIEYWGATTNKRFEHIYGTGWVWQKTIEYYENGTTMHKQWVVDSDPAHAGNVVYEEYNTSGVCIFRVFDNGSVWTPSSAFSNKKAALIQAQNQEPIAIIGINSRQTGSSGSIQVSPQMAGQADGKVYNKILK